MPEDRPDDAGSLLVTPLAAPLVRLVDYAPPSAILFDLDGTLVDTMFHFADLAAEIMAARHGAKVEVARRRYLETSGIPFRHQLEVIHPRHPENEDASEEFEYRKHAICVQAPLAPETVSALEELRSRGIRLVLSSNTGQAFVDDLVEREGFRFDLALGFDASAGMAKGEPHVRQASAVLGVARAHMWFVGDSLKDGELAQGCGLAFVGRIGTFSAEQFQATFPGVRVIDHIAALLEMV